MAFKCDGCGQCCQNLQSSDIYDDLNDGTGVCIYFDRVTKLCKIYENRPLKCNVDKMYEVYYYKYYRRQEYYALNYACCKKLKER